MSRHALVTGGAGFIGSHLVDQLLAENIKVSVVDDFSTGAFENLPQNSQLKVYQGSIKEVLNSNVVGDITEIYHLAAVLSTTAEQNKKLAQNVNIDGTNNLFNLALSPGLKVTARGSFKKPQKKLIAQNRDADILSLSDKFLKIIFK